MRLYKITHLYPSSVNGTANNNHQDSITRPKENKTKIKRPDPMKCSTSFTLQAITWPWLYTK